MDLNRVLADVRSDLELQLDGAGAELAIGELPCVSADGAQMAQLFQNLVRNSLKYAREDAAPRITLSGRSDALRGRCIITVSDNGIGFDPQFADAIFEPFRRLHPREAYSGSGMGLAICRKIVERHGGCINARSAPGEGSEFIIELPMSGEGVDQA